MRAKFVNKFTRGQDPKTAMQIGQWSVWSNMELILLQAKRDFMLDNYSKFTTDENTHIYATPSELNYYFKIVSKNTL